ncbi:MAG: hypothetical protein RL311_59 [Bacteroidota bacterium]|jgi:hypothetical protein
MRQFQLIVFLIFSFQMMSQTGIGTTTPNASAKLEVAANDKGFLPPRVALTSLNSASPISSPANGLMVINTASAGTFPNNVIPGYYYWNGSSWSAMQSSQYGDVKTGMQVSDHNGWVKLDGRPKSNLTASQQTQANVLGIGDNLPDATNAVLMQSSGLLGTISGSMSTTIAQNQLPNISPTITVTSTTATMSSAGAHQHPLNIVPSSTGGYAAGYPNAFKYQVAPSPMNESYSDITDRGELSTYVTTAIIGSSGTHSHTIDAHTHSATSTSINGGVTQQSINITPRSLVVNTFIYLGY